MKLPASDFFNCVVQDDATVGFYPIAQRLPWAQPQGCLYRTRKAALLLSDLLRPPRSTFAIGLAVALITIILMLERFTIR